MRDQSTIDRINTASHPRRVRPTSPRIVAASVLAAALVGMGSTMTHAKDVAIDEPILRNGTLIFPGGAAIPRYMTEMEKRYVRENPLSLLRSATDPPEGPIHTVAEYEPMAGVMFGYTGSGSWKDILDEMAYHITTVAESDVYVICPNSNCISEVQTWMIGNAGADPNRVHIEVHPLNSIWIRDYGPRFIYEGEVRAIIDHTYNRPRPFDDALPGNISQSWGRPYYQIPLVHGGGNYHLDAVGDGYTTRLINNENPSLTESQIRDLFQMYQNLYTHFYDPFPTAVDATQHIDMWMQVVDNDRVVISTWPNEPSSTQQQICDFAANHFASRGFTVFRTPAVRSFGTHYNYTNVALVNNLLLIPSYTNSTASPFNNQALQVWQAAMPNHEIRQVNCQAIVTAAGVMHCVIKHVPVHLGGDNPTAFLRSPRGGELFDPDQTVEIRWITDDNDAVVSIDLLLSTDGGNSYNQTVASGINDSGSFLWTVPDIATDHARIRVVAHNTLGNTGFDESPSNFSIDGTEPSIPGDLNGDGQVNLQDLMILINNWGPCPGGTPGCLGDLNNDGQVNLQDLMILINNWG